MRTHVKSGLWRRKLRRTQCHYTTCYKKIQHNTKTDTQKQMYIERLSCFVIERAFAHTRDVANVIQICKSYKINNRTCFSFRSHGGKEVYQPIQDIHITTPRVRQTYYPRTCHRLVSVLKRINKLKIILKNLP